MKINFPDDHNDPVDSQVIIAITGTPDKIAEKLTDILTQYKSYGKPIQGTTIGYKCTATVITPFWDKREY